MVVQLTSDVHRRFCPWTLDGRLVSLFSFVCIRSWTFLFRCRSGRVDLGRNFWGAYQPCRLSTLIYIFFLGWSVTTGIRWLSLWPSGKNFRGKRCQVSRFDLSYPHFFFSTILLQFTFLLRLQGDLSGPHLHTPNISSLSISTKEDPPNARYQQQVFSLRSRWVNLGRSPISSQQRSRWNTCRRSPYSPLN